MNDSFKSDILKNYAVFHADFSQKMFEISNAKEGAGKTEQERLGSN